MVANQPTRCTTSSGLHATAPSVARTARAARAARDLRTSHLFGAGAAQQRLDLGGPRGLARDEDAELVVREAGIVGDGPETARREHRAEGAPGAWGRAAPEPARREPVVEADPEEGEHRPKGEGHLKHDDEVGGDGADGLAAH